MKKIFATITISVASFMYGQIQISTDKTFGNNGKATVFLDLEVSDSFSFNIIDNKILAWGEEAPLSTKFNHLYRFDINGNLDTSFGTNGKLYLPDYKGNYHIYPQGNKYIVAFHSKILKYHQNNSVADKKILIRYNNDGTLDTSFGNNGEVKIDFQYTNNSELQNHFISIYPDNSIIVNNGATLTKLTKDGQLDNSFGVNGILEKTSFPQILLLKNGNILLSQLGKSEEINSNGEIVNTFNFNKNPNDYLISKEDLQGNIYSIEDKYGDKTSINLYYMDRNGNPINNFGTNGVIEIPKEMDEIFTDIFKNEDGFFIAGASSNDEASIYYFDNNGNRQNINSLKTFVEKDFIQFDNIFVKEKSIYVSGSGYDETTKKHYFVLTKYLFNNHLSSAEVKPEFSEIVFTNPVKGTLYFQSKNSVDKIDLYNSEGRLVKTIKNNNTNISELTKGLYLAKVSFINGTTTTKKLIIE